MSQPYRLPWVIVLLDMLDTCATYSAHVGRRAVHVALHVARHVLFPSQEAIPTLIVQRIRSGRGPSGNGSSHSD